MTYCFDATHIFIEDDGYMTMMCFANDDFEPSKFVILQKAYEYDDKEKQMGMDKIHIQVENESESQYGGIKTINMKTGNIQILLTDDAKFRLGVGGDIVIRVATNHPTFKEIVFQLQKML